VTHSADLPEASAEKIFTPEDSGRGDIDYVYIAASALDARYTRICVASIRYFYPDVTIRILAGGKLDRSLVSELRRFWDVHVEKSIPSGDYGWGFVKLEPLFGPAGQRFLVLDSDTILAGPVLHARTIRTGTFLVDDESQTEADLKRLYYDWQEVAKIDRRAQPPRLVFNSGQWFGTAGILTRDDFAPWIDWTMPRQLRFPALFMPGDQGILNYVLNQKTILDGLDVRCRKIMRWPGRSLEGLNVASVVTGTAPPVIIHWAGMKRTLLRHMVGKDLLQFFEELYYRRLPAGRLWRFVAICRHVWIHCSFFIVLRVKLRCRIWFGRETCEKNSPAPVTKALES
jgi:hypothetical protein